MADSEVGSTPSTAAPRRSALAAALGVAVLVVVVVALAGCGSSEPTTAKPAAAILAASRAAARNAPAVHVRTQLFDPATRRANTKAIAKPRQIGTLELQLSHQAGRARLVLLGRESEAIRDGSTLYAKGSPIFYERLAQSTGTHLTPGTWVTAPAKGAQLAELAALTEPAGELTLMLRDPTVSLTKGALTTINGRKAIELKTTGKLYTGAIYIAATGTPYPLMIVEHGRQNSTTLFTGWSDPVSVKPPAHAVALSQLEHHKAS